MLPKPFFFTGSSPRTRGTAVLVRSLDGRPRFIPAHAGNRAPPGAVRAARAVHPRARGEQSAAASKGSVTIGSSPRTRGTVTRNPMTGRRPRFIPAHAGNSRCRIRPAGALPVHPRARGEQAVLLAMAADRPGSSPRTRGTVAMEHGKLVEERFIPAHAGNRRSTTHLRKTPPVHPRARGEQRWRRRAVMLCCGSSPRTRGTARITFGAGIHQRFIPAHAGNSSSAPAHAGTRAVHPRARGEQGLSVSQISDPSGSSPRTRGTGCR